MKMKSIGIAICVSLALLLSTPAAAQFGGFGKKKEDSGGGASQADVELQQENLVKSFAGAQVNLMEAQSLLAEALGLKELKETLDAERDAFGKGNVDKKALKKSTGTTKDAQKKINEKMKEADELSDESKALLAQSMVPYAQSVGGVVAMVQDATNLANGIQAQIKSAGMMGAMKVKKTFDVGLYLAPKVPGFAKDMTLQLKDVVSYAKSNRVEIPADASALL